MAEAFATVGLASNIAQFIECGIKIVSMSKEAYESARGITKETRELNLIVEDVRNQSREVMKKTSSIRLSKDELAIQNYAEECYLLARELSSVLKKLIFREDARSRTIESGRVAMQTILKRKEVHGLKSRLQDLDGKLRPALKSGSRGSTFQYHIRDSDSLVRMHGQERIASKLQLDEIRDEILILAKAAEAEHLGSAERAAQLAGLATKLIALVNERDRGERQLKVMNKYLNKGAPGGDPSNKGNNRVSFGIRIEEHRMPENLGSDGESHVSTDHIVAMEVFGNTKREDRTLETSATLSLSTALPAPTPTATPPTWRRGLFTIAIQSFEQTG